jgi:hypothetical protein
MKRIDYLINALTKAQSEIENVKKDGTNPYFNSGYATLESVLGTVKKPLNENGVYFQQIAHEREGGIGIETVLYGHGASLSSGVLFIPAVKNDPHAYGSSLSYAKRYSLLMACGLGSQDDDDGNRAVEAIKKQASTSKPIQPKTTVGQSDF